MHATQASRCIANIVSLACTASNIEPPSTSPTKEGCHWQAGGENRRWPIQPDILSPPLLRLTSRKPLWLNLQPVDIKSRWRHNWKSAQVVNSYLLCNPTIRQPGFDFPRQQWSLLNLFSHGTGTLRCLQKEMATHRHWSVSIWRDPDNVWHCRILFAWFFWLISLVIMFAVMSCK